MKAWLRSLSVWLVIMFVESIHGTLREMFLAPIVGDITSRRIAVFTGMLLILFITLLFIRWIDPRSTANMFAIGISWALMTLAFEFVLGLFVFGYSNERMLEDYDLSRGGLLSFGMLFMVCVPWLAASLRPMVSNKFEHH